MTAYGHPGMQASIHGRQRHLRGRTAHKWSQTPRSDIEIVCISPVWTHDHRFVAMGKRGSLSSIISLLCESGQTRLWYWSMHITASTEPQFYVNDGPHGLHHDILTRGFRDLMFDVANSPIGGGIPPPSERGRINGDAHLKCLLGQYSCATIACLLKGGAIIVRPIAFETGTWEQNHYALEFEECMTSATNAFQFFFAHESLHRRQTL